MSDERKPPHRAFTLKMEVDADDREALCGYLQNFITDLHMDKVSTGVSGSYSAGAVYSLTIDPEMTHERWVVELDAYIALLEQAKSTENTT